MIRIRRYNDAVRARAAAAFLRDNEINATVVGDHVHSTFGATSLRFFGMDLMIANDVDRAHVEQLLNEFETEPLEVEDGWEHAALPDLSKLEADNIEVSCPNCRVSLPLDATLESCPSCKAPVDIASLIARTYGPDVLIPCFEDESVMDFAIQGKALSCSFCGYTLRGLAGRGRCPECGSLYDIDGNEKEGSP